MNRKDEGYGSTYRAAMKHSMAEPANMYDRRLDRSRRRADKIKIVIWVLATFLGGWALLHWALLK